ncbi:hypothetical protein PSN45_005052 [Yamadazyma tenuis]|uniref:Proteasome chaperone 3 n=1 Tax=Candida tenuis (strain ATCC 10573 / BCRC 21748 / CBS 615 / JCM 9827 / NBRC 10315 / NRRL Y-1498 / VKM Y-70) TaxID=590646 RepID=G3B2L9_CANTC|nr:uncharacterized protein CANTEDRAFT_97565 [Yamadazyma tenuis ATCC 10573]EGV64713.1 hypothetical protein CANTEDRAFT_97565 [Yamadazyma tenuis ATCC 10573]WEJ97499.1 hypothetical protein PSN45_005052 [Yamadazyma tenuis]
MSEPKFSTHLTKTYPDADNTEVTFHKIEAADTIILNVLTNGIADTTFELPLNSQHSINILSNLSNFEDDEEKMGIEPRVIVGDHNNLKIQVVASQIGKLLLSNMSEPKSVILSIGSRWFGKSTETNDEDFKKLMFVLTSVNELLAQSKAQ